MELPDFNDVSRRDFLRLAAVSGLSVGAMSLLGACNLSRVTTSGDRPVRKCFATLEQNDPDNIIGTYREAVRLMKNLPSSDPRNWLNQAYIHGRNGRFTDCEHGNWLFLPWHRAYLFYLEDICRELTGNQNFALPFWNWSDNPDMPQAFEDMPGGNPLYDSTRANTSVSGDASTRPAAIQSTLADPNFLRFAGGWANPSTGRGSGSVEAPPHNRVHSTIGGNMVSAASPRDPLFYVHHCMVDYLWWEWNANLGNPNTNDPNWWQSSFAGDFVDKAGEPVENIGVLATILMPGLSYNYEPCFSGGSMQMVEITPELRDSLEEGADVELERVFELELAEGVQVGLEDPVRIAADGDLTRLSPFAMGEEPGRILVSATNIQPPEDDAIVTRVFVNRPEQADEFSVDSPHFAGSFAFFLAEEEQMEHDFFVDITEPLMRLMREEAVDPGDPVSIELVSVPIDNREIERGNGNYAIGRLSVTVTRSIINGEVREVEMG